MKTTAQQHRNGFTLIEILAAIAIIGILAAIMVPLAGNAKKTAQKRRAQTEMQSIKVAVVQFYDDHRYMPWPDNPKVGEDKWASDAATQQPVMDLLTGNNPKNKVYLQIPEKSRPADKTLVFNDPWGQPYHVGMDRNMDGAVTVQGTQVADWDNKTVMEKVLVFSPGLPDENEPLKTFDVPN